MRKETREGSWYGDSTLEGDDVVLYRDSNIRVNNLYTIGLPPGQSNLLQLVATRWNGQVLVAGQGQSNNNWLWKDNKWNDLGPSFATFSCAFGPGTLYLIVGPNQYRVLDLESMILGPITGRAIGSNGIRYIDFFQSPDGIVTGDSTYGPGLYNLSQWTKREGIVVGQSYIDGCVAFLSDIRYKLEPGDTQFIRFKRSGNNLSIAIVKMLEKSTVFYWMTVDELKQFPIEGSNPPDKKPGPVNTGDDMPTAPNKQSTVQRMIKLHPEIDTLDEEQRGKILDYVCNAENKPGTNKPWGRKARASNGSNKNTDALCYLLSDGRFEIYDVISGGDGSATWDYAGTFSQGENGYWAEAESVSGEKPPTDKPVESKPVNVNKDDVRDGANAIINFYTSDEGLQRSKPPIDVNDQAAWDWVSVYLTSLANGKPKNEALDEVRNRIKTFPEWKQKHP